MQKFEHEESTAENHKVKSQGKRPKKKQEVTYKMIKLNKPSQAAIKETSKLIYEYLLDGRLLT